MESLVRELNALQDPDRNRRRQAFEKILKVASDPAVDIAAADQLSLIKAVLRGFEDKAERCRETAIRIVVELLPHQTADILDWILPSVVSRIGLEPVAEDSEELRLQLLQLALQCVDQFPHDLGPRNFLDYYRVLLENCLRDSFPELKRLACVGCRRLCEIEPKRVKPFTVPLAKVVKNMCLQHKHSLVRAEAVRTFGALLSHGAVELLGDMKDEQDNRTTVYNFHVLICDNSESVRSAVVEFLSQMLLDIPERGDQHRRLIPHVLILLTDENEAVRVAANSLLLKLGKLYMIDNEDNSIDLQKRRVTMKDIEWYGDESYPSMSLVTSSTLPLPDLQNRPILGARFVVAEIVRTVLDKVLADCLAMDWTIPFSKHNKRVVALRCLMMLIYYSETNVVQFAQQILAALYKSIKDDNEVVRTESLVCVELLGKFMTPDQYLPFLVAQPNAASGDDGSNSGITVVHGTTAQPPQQQQQHVNPESEGDLRVERSRTKTITMISASEQKTVHQHLPTLFSTAPHSTKSSILTVFKYILLGSTPSITISQATLVVRALTNVDLMDMDAPELLLSLIDAMISFATVLAKKAFIPTVEHPMPDSVRLDVKQRTLDSMMLYALLFMKQCSSPAVVQACDAATAKLSQLVTGDPTAIFTLHFGRLLIRHHATMPVCAFSDLVLNASNVPFYTAELVSVFVQKLADVNYQLRATNELQYFSVLDGLLRGKKIAFTSAHLEELLRSVILHHGSFKPGGTAHLFRKVAMGALAAVLQPFHRAKLRDALAADGNALAEKIVSMWLSCADSDDADMRLVCIHSLCDVVQLPMSPGCAADVWQHVLLRLDDSNDQLRLDVATQLHQALKDRDLMVGSLRSEILQKLAASVKKLLIHMDDHEEQRGIKGVVSKCLMELCHADRTVVVALVQAARPKHNTPRYCDDVLRYAAEMSAA